MLVKLVLNKIGGKLKDILFLNRISEEEHLLDLERGSRGPSTVTLMALL